jgi:MFS family permease
LLGGDIPLRPLGAAEILDGAISIIRHNPRGVLGLSLVVTTVVQVVLSLATYLLVGDTDATATPDSIARSLGTEFTLSLFGLLMSAYAVLLLAGMLGPTMGRTLFGLPSSLRQMWRDARPRLFRLIGVATLAMTISALALILPIAPFVALASTDGPVALSVTLGIVGGPLGLCLMIWLYVLFALAPPTVVIERRGIFSSLARARRLVRGKWWRTCGILLLTLLITIFMGFFALRTPFLIAALVLFGADPTGSEVVFQLALDTAGRIVSWTLTTPFDAGVIALLYVDRRMRREGFDLDLQTRDEAEVRPDDFLDLWRPISVTTSTASTTASTDAGRRQ